MREQLLDLIKGRLEKQGRACILRHRHARAQREGWQCNPPPLPVYDDCIWSAEGSPIYPREYKPSAHEAVVGRLPFHLHPVARGCKRHADLKTHRSPNRCRETSLKRRLGRTRPRSFRRERQPSIVSDCLSTDGRFFSLSLLRLPHVGGVTLGVGLGRGGDPHTRAT